MELLPVPPALLLRKRISEPLAFQEAYHRFAPILSALSEAKYRHAVRVGDPGFVRRHDVWFSRCCDGQRR
jgi:hypothetical protein